MPDANSRGTDDRAVDAPTLLEYGSNYIIFFSCFNCLLPERLVESRIELLADLSDLFEPECCERAL